MIACADAVDVLAGREVHHRVGAEVDRRVQLFQLLLDVAGHGRVADVGVDLALGGDADGHRLQPAGEVDLVGRNDHPPGGDFVADQLRRKAFALADEFHFGRDLAGTGGFDLSGHFFRGQGSGVGGQANGRLGMMRVEKQLSLLANDLRRRRQLA